MTQQPSYGAVACPFVARPGDPGLVGGWNMVEVQAGLPDVTGNGNDGVIGVSTLEDTILGPMRRYGPNSGASVTTFGAPGAYPLSGVTVEFWERVDEDVSVQGYPFLYRASATDEWGIHNNASGAISIYDDIDNAGTYLYTKSHPPGKLVHVVATMNALSNALYLDRSVAGSGTLSTGDWASFAGQLQHGTLVAATAPMSGIIGPLKIYNYAFSADQVARAYLRSAGAIPFRTMYGAVVSTANETAGFVGQNSTPFEIISGTWKISAEMIDGVPTKVIECVAAGKVAIPTSLFFATPTEAAFGSVQFLFYKGAAGNNPRVLYVASTTGNVADAGQVGYYWQVDNTQTASIRRMTGGGTTGVATGSVGGFPVMTWTQVDLTNRYDGQKTQYQDEVQDAQATDNTVTTSAYVVLDFDNGDKMGYCDARGGRAYVHRLICAAPSELPHAA